MMAPELPDNEQERMAAILDLEILDTEREAVFDRITRLASHIIDTPVFLITFVEGDRQWFKSVRGWDLTEGSRENSFCGHAIHSDEVMVVPDTLDDPRFVDNPLVTGELGMRFYAGAPLILRDGIRLGTLCAIDTKPMELEQDQLDALSDLAAVVVDELGLRKGLRVQAEISIDLREQATELQHANQALEQYVHMASHDLRAPVQNLVNLADLAMLDTEGEIRDLVEPMRHSAVEMEELVLGYGRLASLTRGRLELRNISELIDQAHEASGRVLDLQQTGDAALLCDTVLVSQALVNLFQNAEKYGVGGCVTVETTDEDEFVGIAVSNPVKATFAVDQSVFAPFKRLVTDGKGSGLGLSIVERVAQLHGGSVSAYCALNTFTVKLTLPKVDPG
ncbi:MAG: GAF domain-containing sensor histidine kinase [Acidimicrobiales bacterium]|nr:GAF domain-containing sensor histidine kinase [Acidimicrobiales bacterium]